MRILYCASDHGYGHVGRGIPVINELLERGHTVYVRNSSALFMLRREVHHPNFHIIEETNDVGVIQLPGSYVVDRKATKQAVTKWMDGWKEDVKRLQDHITTNKIDLVVSDSSPQPHIAAEKEAIPSVFLGHFTWIDIYKAIDTITPAQEKTLRVAYNKAKLGIVMPFEQACEGILKKHKVAIVARHPTKTRRIPRSIVYTLSGSMNGTTTWKAKDFTGIMILSATVKDSPAKRFIRMDQSVPSIDYIAASDVILAKSGYTIMAEAINCKKPAFLLKRDGFIDDEKVVETVKKLGIGIEVKEKDLPDIVNDGIFEKAKGLQKNYKRLPAIYRRDGVKDAVDMIERFDRKKGKR